jgi:hypothetical protein
MASVERSVPSGEINAFSAAAIGIRFFFFARDSDWLRELESEKPLRLPLLPSVEPLPSFCYLATFAETEGSGEVSEQKKTKATENRK